jgi:hypothetical protein
VLGRGGRRTVLDAGPGAGKAQKSESLS